MNPSNDFVKTQKVPEDTKCLCGDAECAGLTAAFADLRDARQRFVRLPPHEHVDSPFYQEHNRRRQAYLRHVLPNHDSAQETSSDFIALHHFHPEIVKENTRKIPKSLSLGQAVQLKMMLSEKDKVVPKVGLPYFIFVPSYEKNQVKSDLETLTREAQKQDYWSGTDDESDASTVKIPQHISVDEESDISSIDFIVDEERDKVTLMHLVLAAITCQKFIRLCQAKVILNRKLEERSAIVIQARGRGAVVRSNSFIVNQTQLYTAGKEKVKSDETTASNASTGSDIDIVGIVDSLEEETPEDKAASKIQAAWRRSWAQFQYRMCLVDIVVLKSIYGEKSSLSTTQEALTALQSVILGWTAKKSNSFDEVSVSIKTKWKRHDIKTYYERKGSRAVRVQSDYRRRLVHRDLRFVRAGASAIQASCQSWKCNWPRIESIQYRLELPDVIQLQCLVRRQAAIAESERRKAAVLVLQSFARTSMVMRDLRNQHEAATVIQAMWRGILGLASFLLMLDSAILIQGLVRGHLLRRQLHRKPGISALTIQTAWRRYWTRRDYILYLHDVVLMQSLVRQRAASQEGETRKQAVLLIQCMVRRWIACNELKAQKEASVSIQRTWRRCAAHALYKQKQETAIIFQSLVRGLLIRRNAEARMSSALLIQAAWRQNFPKLQHKKVISTAATRIEAFARGFLCRKRMGFMLVFIQLKVAECERQKMYGRLLQDGRTRWQHCIDMLKSGIKELSRAERLVVGSFTAGQAFASALRSISQDTFLDDEYGVITDNSNRKVSGSTHRSEDMPTDQVLQSLMKADAIMADRLDSISGCGAKEIGPELSSLRNSMIVEMREVEEIGSALLKALPTLEMKATEEATRRAWDELEACVRHVWHNRGPETKKSKPKLPEHHTEASAGDKLLVPFPSFGEAPFEEKWSVVASPVSSPSEDVLTSVNISRETRDSSTPPMLPMSPDLEKSDKKNQARHVMSSPQSVMATCENSDSPTIPSRSCSLFSRQSSGWNPFASDSSIGESREGTPPAHTRKNGSSFRKVPSNGQLWISRGLNADDCISILSEEGLQKKGRAFFEHVRTTLLSKNADAPPDSLGMPSLNRGLSPALPLVKDRWLLETNYYCTVTQQEMVWNTCLSLVSKMNEAVKEIELERSTKLSSVLFAALPLERRVFLEAKEVHESVVDELLGIRHDRQYLSESIDIMIDHYAGLLRHRDSDHKSSILNRSRRLTPDLTSAIEPLESEKTYGITHQAMVVERSVGLRSWKTTLVVGTVDHCMHLFDVSFIPDITLESSATEAFDCLLPDDDFSDVTHITPHSEKLLKYLTPVSSVNLRNCTISNIDKRSVEVAERQQGLFRDKTIRRFMLRGNPRDLQSWKRFLIQARQLNS